MKRQITMIPDFDFLLDFNGLEEHADSSKNAGEVIAALFSGMVPLDPKGLPSKEDFVKESSSIMDKHVAENIYTQVSKAMDAVDLPEEEDIDASHQLKLRQSLRKNISGEYKSLLKNLSDFATAPNLDESRAGYIHSKAFKRLRAILKPAVTDDQIVTGLFTLRNQAVMEILLIDEATPFEPVKEEVEKTEKKAKKAKKAK